MKKQLITGLFAALAVSGSAQSFKEWQDPQGNAGNPAPMHPHYFAYQAAHTAAKENM